MIRLLPLLLLGACLPNGDCPTPSPFDPIDDFDGDGFTEEDGDCDDQDAEVYPGAFDVCGDGIDQDCDGRDPVCLLGIPRSLATADGSADGVWPPARAYDITGTDGDDLITGVQPGTAQVWTFDDGLVLAATISDSANAAGERVGGPGDVTGDGIPDLLVGRRQIYRGTSPGPDDVFLIPGPVSGELFLPNAAHVLAGTPLHSAGEALSGPVDYDGDGTGDVLIGAPHLAETHPGEAVLVMGPVTADIDLADAEYRFVGEEDRDGAGRVVNGAGDVDGDGADDIVIGTSGPEGGGDRSHLAYLVLSGREPGVHLLADAEGRFEPGAAEYFAPIAVDGAGDTDGDGYHDVIVGSFRIDGYAGGAWLFRGGPDPSFEDAEATFTAEGGMWLGFSVGTAGDIDEDGGSEFLVSAPNLPWEEPNGAGISFLVNGTVAGRYSVSAPDPLLVPITGPSERRAAGRAVGGAGDLDADGYSDLYIGTDTEAGGLWVLLGGVEP